MMRIVSLVPSLTETLCDLGLKSSLVGCTQFCVKPPGLHKSANLVGGTKNPDLAAIQALKPTHILVNEEENKPEHIAACRAIAPTLLSFPKSPKDVPSMLRDMGAFLNCTGTANDWAESITAELQRLETIQADSWLRDKTCLYFIWREPYMLAAADTYISSMLALAGLANIAPATARYPKITMTEVTRLKPNYVLLSSEPYPFRRRDGERFRQEWQAVSTPPDLPPDIFKADGQLFSWYGTLTLVALQNLRRWLSREEQRLVTAQM